MSALAREWQFGDVLEGDPAYWGSIIRELPTLVLPTLVFVTYEDADTYDFVGVVIDHTSLEASGFGQRWTGHAKNWRKKM